MNNRAKAGGEYGMNGEHYEGGQFLPNTTLGKMAKRTKKNSPRKCEIAPYTWEVAPEGMKSIYTQLAGRFVIITNGKMVVSCKDQTLAYYNYTREQAQEMATRWNNGERWMKVG